MARTAQSARPSKTAPRPARGGKSLAGKQPPFGGSRPPVGAAPRGRGRGRGGKTGQPSSRRPVQDDQSESDGSSDSDDPSPDPAEEKRLALLTKKIADSDEIPKEKTDHGTIDDFSPFDLIRVEEAYESAELLPVYKKETAQTEQGWADYDVRAIHRNMGYVLLQK